MITPHLALLAPPGAGAWLVPPEIKFTRLSLTSQKLFNFTVIHGSINALPPEAASSLERSVTNLQLQEKCQ